MPSDGGSSNDGGDGNDHGGSGGPGNSSGGGRSGAGSGQSAAQGRGGQADVGGKNSSTGDSADHGGRDGGNSSQQSHQQGRGGQVSASDRSTSVAPSSRARDAMDRRASITVEQQKPDVGIVDTSVLDAAHALDNPSTLSTRLGQRQFDKARENLSMPEKHSIADTVAENETGTINTVANGVGLLGGPIGAGIATAGTAMNTAKSKVDAMEMMGVHQSLKDFGYETARNALPGIVGEKAAPVGAMVGANFGGVPGALVGGVVAGYGAKSLTEHAMNPANATDQPATPSSGLGEGAEPATPTSSIASAKAAFSSPSVASTPSYGAGSIDMNNYQGGLLTARI